ncbi:MAG: lysylphosphatidylglycerol synthase transmembrane domain-containing protein [Pseudomonadota bacterium]
MPRTKIVRLVQLLATILIFIYLFGRVDVFGALAKIKDGNFRYLALGTAILALQPIVGAFRWSAVLYALHNQFYTSKVLRWNYVGVFFGQALPAMVGADAIRIWLAGRDEVGWHDSIVSVLIDRIAMLIILAVLLLFGLPQIGDMLSVPWAGWLVPLFLVGGIAGVVALFFVNHIPEHLDKHRLVRAVRYLSEGTRRLVLQPMALALTTVLCILSYLGLMASVYLYTQAFGASSDPLHVLVLLPPVLLASMLPVSLGGWGTRELAMVAALGLVGISADTALLTSVWLGISSILIALPGMVFFLVQRIDLRRAQSVDILAETEGD